MKSGMLAAEAALEAIDKASEQKTTSFEPAAYSNKIHEQVTALLEGYKKYPCPYNCKNILYKNKHARINALSDIQGQVSLLRLNVTVAEIKAKYAALRQIFFSEHNKHLASMKSGAGTDEVCMSLVSHWTETTDQCAELHTL